MTPLPAGVPGLLGLDHVGIATPDLELALAEHTERLGLRLVHREENLDQAVAEAMLEPAGASPGATLVQLLAPLHAESAVARFLARRGPGLHHLAYRVGDIEAAAAALRDHGWLLLYDAARAGTRGSLINFVHPRDTGGVLLELVQAGPDRERG